MGFSLSLPLSFPRLGLPLPPLLFMFSPRLGFVCILGDELISRAAATAAPLLCGGSHSQSKGGRSVPSVQRRLVCMLRREQMILVQ